ncbi:DgyrCDS2992 [Dimorphilus gyrociliatus]|uniref:DgyrCDS2992 n=1 Tax=Dimorphilus gyrociliatus TaxID=2664684 RepID=A0A7I8VEX6_9ANNE|nr:DgyrCDS2992 [Dimorphilus gyrociliatus]
MDHDRLVNKLMEICDDYEEADERFRPSSQLYQPYNGQIQLAIYVNSGLITVHIIEGKNLNPTNANEPCHSFVQVNLAPDRGGRTTCRTETIYCNRCPVYDEKFSFELLEGDERKRVIIAVWQTHYVDARYDEFLGCTSFGVKSIIDGKKTVDGWYYLLTQDVGIRKHLRASKKKNQLRRELSSVDLSSSLLQSEQSTWLESKTVTPSSGFLEHIVFSLKSFINFVQLQLLLKRDNSGYGFTITGKSPARVCKVDKGSQAILAGLQCNDVIIRLDNINVSKLSADAVVRLIRNCPHYMVLEIQRLRQPELSFQKENIFPLHL